VQVVGISKSRARPLRRFIDYLDLTFALFSDTDLSVAEATT
jgi:peroxiredoxin